MSDSEKIINLAPCPFCGNNDNESLMVLEDRNNQPVIACYKCELIVQVNSIYPEYNNIEELIKRWNTRFTGDKE